MALAGFLERLAFQKSMPLLFLESVLTCADQEVIFGFLLGPQARLIFEKMFPGEGVTFGRIGKAFDQKLPRKVVVVRGIDGHYQAIVDYKSKLVGGLKKKEILYLFGAHKRGKWGGAYRLDIPQPYFAAVVWHAINYPRYIKRTPREEAALSQSFKSEYIHPVYAGATDLSRAGQEGITLYSEQADENLETYLKAREKCEGNILSLLEFEMCLELMKAIKVLHDEKWVHYDLKAANILIFRKHGKLFPKITDLAEAECYKNEEKSFLWFLKIDLCALGQILIDMVLHTFSPMRKRGNRPVVSLDSAKRQVLESMPFPFFQLIDNVLPFNESISINKIIEEFQANREFFTGTHLASDKRLLT